ncbi:hypothetical protein EDD18DRAFT_1109508 [Armillaria luteobubalina]|uniref:Uncharacterized protein n=1 Tax=Armillaria luteobubalina TaxID=153913 RepID=A0AA39PWL0_9AGAR|nr:hypothetical protein EDD18DRAFT_1109508 [Armillaria luteobubalina]
MPALNIHLQVTNIAEAASIPYLENLVKEAKRGNNKKDEKELPESITNTIVIIDTIHPFSSLKELILDIPLSINIHRKLMQLLPAFPVLTMWRIMSRSNENLLATLTGYGFDLPKLLSKLCFASTEIASYWVLAMSHSKDNRIERSPESEANSLKKAELPYDENMTILVHKEGHDLEIFRQNLVGTISNSEKEWLNVSQFVLEMGYIIRDGKKESKGMASNWHLVQVVSWDYPWYKKAEIVNNWCLPLLIARGLITSCCGSINGGQI